MRKNERRHDDSEGGANDKQYDLSWILYLAPDYLSFYLKFQKTSNRRLSIKLTT